MAGTYAVFNKAERLEQLSAEVYRAAAEAFPAAPEAQLLKRLADEEDQHAVRIRLLASRYRHDSSLFQNTDFKLKALDALILEAQGLKREIDAGRWKDDLPGLIARLAELEARGESSHADLLAQGADPQVEGFFRRLAEQDRAHLEVLRGQPIAESGDPAPPDPGNR
jgi:rubrerythrin